MTGNQELNTVVDAARKTEIDGRRFYAATAAKSGNPLARQMFESLAAAEEQHLEFIDQLAKGEFSAPPYDGAFARNLATVFSKVDEETQARAHSSDDDIKAIDVGIQMEDRSMAFYRRWAETGTDETVRRFCERMRAEEEDHWRILQSTRDYLDQTGNWYMAQERWSFDGG